MISCIWYSNVAPHRIDAHHEATTLSKTRGLTDRCALVHLHSTSTPQRASNRRVSRGRTTAASINLVANPEYICIEGNVSKACMCRGSVSDCTFSTSASESRSYGLLSRRLKDGELIISSDLCYLVLTAGVGDMRRASLQPQLSPKS